MAIITITKTPKRNTGHHWPRKAPVVTRIVVKSGNLTPASLNIGLICGITKATNMKETTRKRITTMLG